MGMFAVIYWEEGSSLVYLHLLRRGIWACMRSPCLCLLGFGMWTMLANFHVCGIIFLLIAVLNILVRSASPRGPSMYLRCLIFSLSGPCELLFLLCFIASWT